MDDLLVYEKCKDFIYYVDTYLFSSFPKSDISLKIKFENEMYELLKNITRANFNVGSIRNKHLVECLVSISLMDAYIGYIFKKKIIIKKRFLTIAKKLDELRRMIVGWQKSNVK